MSLSKLNSYEWVAIPGQPYVLKYEATDTGYSILVSNLLSLYGENLDVTGVIKRFVDLNETAVMKRSFIMKHIIESLADFLDGNVRKNTFQIEQNKIKIGLNFPYKYRALKFDLIMDILPVQQMMKFIVGPTIMSALMSMDKVKHLEKKIENLENALLKYSSSAVPGPSDDMRIVERPYLKKKASTQVIVESFVELQSHFDILGCENYAAYNPIKDEKCLGHSDLLTRDRDDKRAPFEDHDSASSESNPDTTSDKEPEKEMLGEVLSDQQAAPPKRQMKIKKKPVKKSSVCAAPEPYPKRARKFRI